jgi:hypothetical protein
VNSNLRHPGYRRMPVLCRIALFSDRLTRLCANAGRCLPIFLAEVSKIPRSNQDAVIQMAGFRLVWRLA